MAIAKVSPANGVSSSDPQAQFDYIVDQLDALGIVYLHVVEGVTGRWRVDPGAVSIGGVSAGGNLAAAVTLKCRREGGPRLAFQLLEVPISGLTGERQHVLSLGMRLDQPAAHAQD